MTKRRERGLPRDLGDGLEGTGGRHSSEEELGNDGEGRGGIDTTTLGDSWEASDETAGGRRY